PLQSPAIASAIARPIQSDWHRKRPDDRIRLASAALPRRDDAAPSPVRRNADTRLRRRARDAEGASRSLLWKCDDHIELDAGAGRRQLVDADSGAGRAPVTKMLAHCAMHGISIAKIGQIFRDFDDVAPARTDMVQDRFD